MDPRQATDALLAVMEEDRARRVEAIGAEARRTTSQILGEARSAARARVRDALAIERRRLRDGLAAIDAALATEVPGCTTSAASGRSSTRPGSGCPRHSPCAGRTPADRLTMLRYGINDLRLFFEGDLRFLAQFN